MVKEFEPRGVQCFPPEYPAPPLDDMCPRVIATMPGSASILDYSKTVYGPFGAPGVQTSLPAVWSDREFL